MAIRLGVIIPAHNEEGSVAEIVGRVLESLPDGFVGRVVVTDNLSTDQTARRAANAGAEVAREVKRGYGAACRAAIARLGSWPQIHLFLDADGSSRPEEMARLLAPIANDEADLVLGVRPQNAPMTPPQRWGSQLAVTLVDWRWGHRFQDMGPFRAIRRESFESLGMRDQTWGWTVEMQILALLNGFRIREVEVSWVRRLSGVSKISGTVAGVSRAGARILWTIARYGLERRI